MNRKELIAELRSRGVKNIGGRPLSKTLLGALIEQLESLSDGVPKHLSFSQINQFQKCSQQYFFRYIQKIKIPPPGIVIQGSAVDDAANFNYTEKIKSGADAPLDTLKDVFVESMKERKDGADWSDPKHTPESLESQGLSMVKIFRDYLAPGTEPVAIQKEYEIKFSNKAWSFLGYADLIANEKSVKGEIVIDMKCTGRMPSEEWVRLHPQLDAYAACYAVEHGEGTEPTVAIDALVRAKKKPDAARIFSTRNTLTTRRWWNTADAIYNAIKAGAFYPAPKVVGGQSNWVCSPGFCGYWILCHQKYGE